MRDADVSSVIPLRAGRKGDCMNRERRAIDWLAFLPYLARADLSRRYAGSGLGAIWAFVFPVLQIAVYWFAFTFGLKAGRQGAASFAVMLVSGMMPWFVLSDALTGMATSITGNAALVKRVVIPIAILPSARLLTALIVHACILPAAIVVLWLLGSPPTPWLLTLPIYTVALTLFLLAAGSLLALANAAIRDVSQVIASILLLWFWATPIVWPVNTLPANLAWIATANPMTYIVEGYRVALTGSRDRWPHNDATAWFWGETAVLAILAIFAIQRFKKELADLL